MYFSCPENRDDIAVDRRLPGPATHSCPTTAVAVVLYCVAMLRCYAELPVLPQTPWNENSRNYGATLLYNGAKSAPVDAAKDKFTLKQLPGT
ncbi:hypothetical protein CANINC_001324 [Pichia inconspicua]|uniref:Uncharacterized protein n=1 Tax=Pichia inconspicua TaxID=52247 RepID=A0A4V6TTS7_9ASCO|nr:hypothetical protein CANINC_001324 [[Candida] inconspicua]